MTVFQPEYKKAEFSNREYKNQLNQLELAYQRDPTDQISDLYRQALLKAPFKQGANDPLVHHKTIACANAPCPNIQKRQANHRQPCRFNHAPGLIPLAQEVLAYRNNPDPHSEQAAASIIDN
jgi:hypothetical protein